MKATLRLGTAVGASVCLHWSVLGAVALLVAIVSTGMSAAHPGHSPLVYAAAGPLVSRLAAAAFAVLTWLAAAVGLGEPWTPVLGYLAGVNVLLAVFNLIPAAPLDGGRVLRAALWAWRGGRIAAAVWSARVGRAVALRGLGVEPGPEARRVRT